MTSNLRTYTGCSFSNPVSHRSLLTCDDAGGLTRCHRVLVSNSCHFFGTPLPIPLATSNRRGPRTTRRKIPSRDSYPRGSATHSPALVGDERPSSTVHLVSPIVDNLSFIHERVSFLNACRARRAPSVRLTGSACLTMLSSSRIPPRDQPRLRVHGHPRCARQPWHDHASGRAESGSSVLAR